MTARAGEHKQVPDEMIVAHPFGGEECDSEGVGHAAREEPDEPREGHAHPQHANHHHAEPAEREIRTRREPRIAQAAERRYPDPEQRATPTEPEQQPRARPPP